MKNLLHFLAAENAKTKPFLIQGSFRLIDMKTGIYKSSGNCQTNRDMRFKSQGITVIYLGERK